MLTSELIKNSGYIYPPLSVRFRAILPPPDDVYDSVIVFSYDRITAADLFAFDCDAARRGEICRVSSRLKKRGEATYAHLGYGIRHVSAGEERSEKAVRNLNQLIADYTRQCWAHLQDGFKQGDGRRSDERRTYRARRLFEKTAGKKYLDMVEDYDALLLVADRLDLSESMAKSQGLHAVIQAARAEL